MAEKYLQDFGAEKRPLAQEDPKPQSPSNLRTHTDANLTVFFPPVLCSFPKHILHLARGFTKASIFRILHI